jgi:hypothetical protein
MKRIFLAVFLFPLIAMAQQKANARCKNKSCSTPATKTTEGFTIEADIKDP